MVHETESTFEQIKTRGMVHFARNGYHGASLSAIAEDVGIQKSTIYSHFKSKEALFFACMEDADKLTFADMETVLCAHKDSDLEAILYAFLNQFDTLGEANPHAYFHERYAYFPPEELKEAVIAHSNTIIARTSEMLKPFFEAWGKANGVDAAEIEELLVAYICIYDGVILERMIGTPETYQERMRHTWSFFLKGLQASKTERTV